MQDTGPSEACKRLPINNQTVLHAASTSLQSSLQALWPASPKSSLSNTDGLDSRRSQRHGSSNAACGPRCRCCVVIFYVAEAALALGLLLKLCLAGAS